MKICWDNLEGIFISKNGNFRSQLKHITYVYKDSCNNCGEPYLTQKSTPRDFCCGSCARMGENNSFFGRKHSSEVKMSLSKNKCGEKNPFFGRKHSKETLDKISFSNEGEKNPNYGKSMPDATKKQISKKMNGQRKGILNPCWKGGVTLEKLPLYDTYKNRLFLSDNIRVKRDELGRNLLEVGCSKCEKYFVPSISEVYRRILALDGRRLGESKFYCSQECKDNCEVYGKKAYAYIEFKHVNKLYTQEEIQTWSQEVLNRADYTCEICGAKAEHAHHIQPKKLEPGLVLDPDNGLALCIKCHYKYGHSDECSTGNLANTKCNKEKAYE
jgi:hypothetical protein